MSEFNFLESLQTVIKQRVDQLRLEEPLTFISTSNGYVTRHGGYHIKRNSPDNFEVTWLIAFENPVWLGTVSDLKLAKAICISHKESKNTAFVRMV